MAEEDKLSDKTPTNYDSVGSRSRLKSLSLPQIITSLVIIILVIGGVYLYISQNKPPDSSASYTYQYKKFSTLVLAAKGKGHGIVIQRPDEINVPLTDVQNVLGTVYFVQLKDNKGNDRSGIHIAYLALKSTPYPKQTLGTDNIYRPSVLKTLNNPSNPNYQNATANAAGLAKQISHYGETVKLGTAQAFSNSYVKRYAWQFDISATHSRNRYPPQQGKVLYILGNHGWYYVLVTAEKNNWQANQSFFQKVLSSIKVDQ